MYTYKDKNIPWLLCYYKSLGDYDVGVSSQAVFFDFVNGLLIQFKSNKLDPLKQSIVNLFGQTGLEVMQPWKTGQCWWYLIFFQSFSSFRFSRIFLYMQIRKFILQHHNGIKSIIKSQNIMIKKSALMPILELDFGFSFRYHNLVSLKSDTITNWQKMWFFFCFLEMGYMKI